MIKIINSRPDKFLIECIELDLYDLVYKSMVNQISSLVKEASRILDIYKANNSIKDYIIIRYGVDFIVVDIFAPSKIRITCKSP